MSIKLDLVRTTYRTQHIQIQLTHKQAPSIPIQFRTDIVYYTNLIYLPLNVNVLTKLRYQHLITQYYKNTQS